MFLISYNKQGIQLPEHEKLNNVYNDKNCQISTDENFSIIELNENTKIIFIGRLIGIKSNDELISIHNLEKDLLKLFSSMSVEKAVERLEGRYTILSLHNDKIKIVNDFYSQMDVYYTETSSKIYIASSLNVIPINELKTNYDHSGVIHSLYIYGYRPPKKHTLYEKIKRIGVGEFLLISDGRLLLKKQELSLQSIQDFGSENLSLYKEIFLDALSKRASVNGNVVYLSSGWDSTSILAGLVHLFGKKSVVAVIGRMHFSKEKGVCNPFEIERAKKIADYFDVNLEIVEFDYVNRGPELTEEFQDFFTSQMAGSMACHQWIDLAKHVSKYHADKAIFCGEISDGAHNFGFSQMATELHHPSNDFREYADKMSSYLYGPTFLKSIWNNTFQNDSVYQFLKNKKFGVYDDVNVSNLGKTKQLLASQFTRDNRIPLWSLNNNKYISEYGRDIYKKEIEDIYLDEVAYQVTNDVDKLYAGMIHLYNSFHWNGGSVQTLHMTEDLFNIKLNLPFRDGRLINFLSKMPESWGRGLELKPTKYPLKWMLENSINYPIHFQIGPHSYLYDVDPNFNHGAEWIFRSSFANQYKQIMKERRYKDLMSPEVFDIVYFDKIVDNYLAGEEVLQERADLERLIYLSVMNWY